MKRSSIAFRRLIARIGIFAVLFTQLAVAAYACPLITSAERTMPVAMADDMHAGMPGCSESSGSDNPNLCLQHCQSGSQSVQTTPQVSVPAVAAMPVAILEPVQSVSGSRVAVWSETPARATSPPPLVRFNFLRI